MKWFVEFESGRTEVISEYSPGKFYIESTQKYQCWPVDWPKSVLSAVAYPEVKFQQADLSRYANLQLAAIGYDFNMGQRNAT